MNWKNNEYKDLSYNVFSVFNENEAYLKPSEKSYMINFRVHDLDALLSVLASEGIPALSPENEVMVGIGKFNWIMDPDGNKIELWEQLG